MPDTPWDFPDLPPFLSAFTLEHLAKLQDLVTQYGKKIAVSQLGDVLCLSVRSPEPMSLLMVGPPATGDLIVTVFGGDDTAGHEIVRFPGTAFEGRLIWNSAVTLAALEGNLDPERVIWSSQLRKSAKDGAN